MGVVNDLTDDLWEKRRVRSVVGRLAEKAREELAQWRRGWGRDFSTMRGSASVGCTILNHERKWHAGPVADRACGGTWRKS